MKRNIVVIGDTHFGIKNNSLTWLRHQKEGFREIIEYIKRSVQEYDSTTIIHVGDLFDSRSSINPLVYKEVAGLLDEIDNVLYYGNSEMLIIGGNHDYYYPWETDRNFTGIQMLPQYMHITTTTSAPIRRGNFVLIPWFVFHNPVHLSRALKDTDGDTIIFTHTDPFHMEPNIRKLIGDRRIVTGHIHQPYRDPVHADLLVTGATYPTDFTDTNSERGFWTFMEDENGVCFEPVFHPVHASIHFHTLTEDTLGHWQELGIQEDDYVEVRIRRSDTDTYKDTIKELHSRFTTSIVHIPERAQEQVFESAEVLNVDTVCQQLLPDKLKSLYQNMVEAIEQK